MTKTKKSQYIKSALLVLSTLLVPVQFFSLVFNFLSFPYVSFVVPYLLWKIWFNRDEYKLSPISYFWKIPIILFLIAIMFVAEVEILLAILFWETLSNITKIAIYVVLVLILRCLNYAMMIFIWQPNILKSGKKWAYLGLGLYYVCVICCVFPFIAIFALHTP